MRPRREFILNAITKGILHKNFSYAGSNRKFTSRSAETVVDKGSKKELSEKEILKQVSEKQITQVKAGILLGVSRCTVGRRLEKFLDKVKTTSKIEIPFKEPQIIEADVVPKELALISVVPKNLISINDVTNQPTSIPSVCEVSQVAYKEAKKFLKNYTGRISKSSKKVKNTFTLDNMAKAYYKLNKILLECEDLPYEKCITLSIYLLLCDPCYLLIAYSSLKSRRAGGVDDVPVGNVTLSNIISISKRLASHEYTPKPTKRVFIRKSNGKMRPLGISSTQDKIVQQAIFLILNPLFDQIFLDSSHGFRPKRGCHSAIKSIYHK
jgi:hypothetical protein